MARPLGEIATAVLSRLADGDPMTMRELSKQLLVPIATIDWTLQSLLASGRIVALEPAKVAWSRRPVVRYALPRAPGPVLASPFLWGSA